MIKGPSVYCCTYIDGTEEAILIKYPCDSALCKHERCIVYKTKEGHITPIYLNNINNWTNMPTAFWKKYFVRNPEELLFLFKDLEKAGFFGGWPDDDKILGRCLSLGHVLFSYYVLLYVPKIIEYVEIEKLDKIIFGVEKRVLFMDHVYSNCLSRLQKHKLRVKLNGFTPRHERLCDDSRT